LGTLVVADGETGECRRGGGQRWSLAIAAAALGLTRG